MNEQERIAQLVAEVLDLQQALQVALARIGELEARLNQDSHNSSKPPSSDGYRRRTHPRPPTERKPGGQPGHDGRTRMRQATADQVVRHRPVTCEDCGHALADQDGIVQAVRQVHDLPPIRLDVTDHQVLAVRCPACQHVTVAAFPPAVSAPVQYGLGVRRLAVYLNQRQLVPLGRTVETLADLCGATVSPATVVTWVQQASATLAPFETAATQALQSALVLHVDETGIRLRGRLAWLHVASTPRVTLLRHHAKRGAAATAALGVLPAYAGVLVHDRWATYWQYGTAHALCHAHLQRELTAQAEAGEAWATELQGDLRTWYGLVAQARSQGEPLVPAVVEAAHHQYHQCLATGFAAHPLDPVPKRRGRPKRPPAVNLLTALQDHADAVLRFLSDPRVPLTNNQAERDLRTAKVQQKISGTFRSDAGATAFCRLRSYLGTLRKQGFRLFDGLTAVMAGQPLVPAWY